MSEFETLLLSNIPFDFFALLEGHSNLDAPCLGAPDYLPFRFLFSSHDTSLCFLVFGLFFHSHDYNPETGKRRNYRWVALHMHKHKIWLFVFCSVFFFSSHGASMVYDYTHVHLGGYSCFLCYPGKDRRVFRSIQTSYSIHISSGTPYSVLDSYCCCLII